MKSKICLCNGTILRKDLTRFLPLMLGTGVVLWFLGWSVSMTYDLATEEFGVPQLGIEPVQVFLLLTSLLALVAAVCLFGYLTKKQECDAMHALPVRREPLFFTHCLVALIQFAIPFAILYAFLPGSRGWGFQMVLTFCGWLFYFGLAVFSMMLSGRKLGGLMIFYLLGDLASNLFTMADCLYLPQLPGLYLEEELAFTLTPSGHMASLNFTDGTIGELLLPMGLYALAGVALLAVSLVLYRRRKLERAEDFLAESWLEPVFAWGLGITAACFLVSIGYLMDAFVWPLLILGLAVGYFAARMLFARSVRVFQKKGLLGFAALVAVTVGSVLLVSMDPLGLVTKVPALEQIEGVSLTDTRYSYTQVGGVHTTDPGDIARIRDIHMQIVEEGSITQTKFSDAILYEDDTFFLTYHLANGSELKRCYRIGDRDQLAQVEHLISQPEYLLGTNNVEELMDMTSELEAYGTGDGMIHTRRDFFLVFLADCEAGNMYRADYEEQSAWTVSMFIETDDGGRSYISIDVPRAAENTVAWLEKYFH